MKSVIFFGFSKKLLFFTLLFVFAIALFGVFSGSVARAECLPGTDPLTCLGTVGENSNYTDRSIAEILIDILNAALSLIFLIVLGFLVYGGYYWMVSGGNEEKVRKARQILTASLIGLLIVLSALSIVTFITGAIGVDLSDPTGSSLTDKPITEILNNILTAVLGLVFFVALATMVYGGIRWMTSGGNEDTISEAKRTVIASAIGLIIIMISYAVVNFITSTVG